MLLPIEVLPYGNKEFRAIFAAFTLTDDPYLRTRPESPGDIHALLASRVVIIDDDDFSILRITTPAHH